MVLLEDWSGACLGHVRLIAASEPSETLEDVVSRVKKFGFSLYGGVILNVENASGGFEPRALLVATKPRNKMRANPLSGVAIVREILDHKFYFYFQKVLTKGTYFAFYPTIKIEPTNKIVEVDLKKPQIFFDIDHALEYSSSYGFDFYNSVIINKRISSIHFKLDAALLFKKKESLSETSLDSNSAFLIRDGSLVTKPVFNVYMPGQFRVTN